MMTMTESGKSDAVGTLYSIVVDVNDLEACGEFWSRILGAKILFQDERYLQLGRRGTRPTLMLQRVTEKHKEKNRVHIDVDVADLDEAVNRVLELGGRKLRPVKEYGIEWMVMADPDGNEFCLVKHSR
jgi:predicted enzyme related to lactoylglutathione lyase